VKIKRPTTTNDSGDPTDNCLFDAKRVLRLIEDERYLSAKLLHQSIRDRIQKEIDDAQDSDNKNDSPGRKRSMMKRQNKSTGDLDERKQKALELLKENEGILNKMEDRCRLFEKAKIDLDNDDDWTLAQTLFGVTTYYRRESDGSMSIKLEGSIDDCSLYDQIAVLREFDLNYLWAPFVPSSMTVAHLGKLDTVGWFVVGLPHFGLMRDALFRAIGCDSIYEDGSVLIVATGIEDRPDDEKDDKNNDEQKVIDLSTKSTFGSSDFDAEETRIINEIREDPILKTLDLPPSPKRVGGGRLTIRSFAAQIHLESPTLATTTLVVNIDPNMHFIPQPLLDFVMKRVCGTILNKMQGAAKNISNDPITNLHAIRIREDKGFYKTFLLPKFEGVCKLRGWQMPPISAFELSDAQLEMADAFMSKQKHKSDVKAIQLYSDTGNNLNEYLESPPTQNLANGKSSNGADISENWPKVRTRDMHTDLDEMSDISKHSTASSLWPFSTISNYRREAGERAHRQKLRAIEESRERAAKRLKPKSLDDDDIIRLKQLQNARNRQKALQTQSNGKIANDLTKTKQDRNTNLVAIEDDLRDANRRWKISLRSHGFFKKIFVLQFLAVSLFCLLYLDIAFQKFVAVRDGSFGVERRMDLAAMVYIGLIGSVHSVFCYVAMIYSFSALQLGLIAGKRTRTFYGDYVHYAVVLLSASIIGVGIVKPGIDRILRWMVWKVYSVSKVVKMSSLAWTPDTVLATLRIIPQVIFAFISSAQALTLESNIIGRGISSIMKTSFGFILRTISHPLAIYASTAIKQYEDSFDTIPWREDTFFTTRALFSHSAFFLLVSLLLFNASARAARKAIYIDDDASSKTASNTNILEIRKAATL